MSKYIKQNKGNLIEQHKKIKSCPKCGEKFKYQINLSNHINKCEGVEDDS